MSDFKQVLPHVEAAVRAGVEVPAEHVAPLLAELKRLRDGRETEPAPIDWPARFRAAADRCFDLSDAAMLGIAPILGDLARRLEVQPDFVVEAIGRALLGETDETEENR